MKSQVQNELEDIRRERDKLISLMSDVHNEIKAIAGSINCVIHISDSKYMSDEVKEAMKHRSADLYRISRLIYECFDNEEAK